MTFSTLLPLGLLVLVPVIIVLYMLRPKGKERDIPSLLLWKKSIQNEHSVRFSRKLIRNILMLLEILTLLLLILALMGPALRVGYSAASTTLVIDISGSMNFSDASSGTRFETAVKDMKDYIAQTDAEVSIVAVGADTSILLSQSMDKQKLGSVLDTLACTSAEIGDTTAADAIIASLTSENVVVFTDADGLTDISSATDIHIYGGKSANVSLSQMSAKSVADGKADLAAYIVNNGETEVSAELSIYDDSDALIALRTVKVSAGETKSVILAGLDADGRYLRGELSGLDADTNLLTDDDTAYAVLSTETEYTGYLLGGGNTYIEKAYKAVSGEDIVKSADAPTADISVETRESTKADNTDSTTEGSTDAGITDEVDIYVGEQLTGRLIYVSGTEDGRVIDVSDGFLRSVNPFTLGAKNLTYFELPDWAESYMTTADGGTIGYYGVNPDTGIREITVGFDISDSDFALMAEFPIFMADAVSYLSDSGMLGSFYITAGETPDINVTLAGSITIERDGETVPFGAITDAGLYTIRSDNSEEYLAVRYPVTESDGLAVASDTEEATSYSLRTAGIRTAVIVLAILLLIIHFIIYMRRSVTVDRPVIVLRAVLIIVCILAALGISIPGKKHGNATIFLVDMSYSNIACLDEEEAYLKRVIESMPESDSYGIVTFGRNTLADQFITDDNTYYGIFTEPDDSATDIESAVRTAVSMLPDSKNGRVVILTDGRQTFGDIKNDRELLGDTELCAVLFDSGIRNDAYVESVDMPDTLSPGEAYTVLIDVYSSYETDAVLTVGDSRESVHLSKGTNTYAVKRVAGEDSIEYSDVTIAAEGDELSENDELITAAVVSAAGNVLVISDEDDAPEELFNSLSESFTYMSVDDAPTDMAGMLAYKVIVLNNCHAADLPEGFMDNIESYVRDYGCGFVAIGGDDSFAVGGYRGTALEEVLPVSMIPTGVTELPSVAMVMVIDCSGSMESTVNGNNRGTTKLSAAIDAAVLAVENLSVYDYAGVIAFSDLYEWVQEITKLDDKDSVIDQIESIGIGGGTTIKPALEAAAEKIAETDAGVKHIILLTDGEGETRDFSDITEYMNENGITLTTVAMGTDSDTQLMEQLAEDAGGRYYYADSNTNIPRIFAQEVYLSGTTYIRNGDFPLSARYSSKLMSGIFGEGLPNISGYIASTTKSDAQTIISTDESDPILSVWRYGTGSSAAWTTTAASDWNSGLALDDDYGELWQRIINYVEPSVISGGDYISTSVSKDTLSVRYEAKDYTEDTVITGTYTTPSGENGEITLYSDEPGRYSASSKICEAGVYTISVQRYEAGEYIGSANAIETVRFSDEYKVNVSNEDFISFIESEGRLLTTEDNVFTRIQSSGASRRSMTGILLIIAVILLMLDIVMRRFIPAGWLKRAKVKTVGDMTTVSVSEADADSKDGSSGAANSKADKQAAAETVEQRAAEAESAAADEASSGKVSSDRGRRRKHDGSRKHDHSNKPDTSATLDTAALLKKKSDRNMGDN